MELRLKEKTKVKKSVTVKLSEQDAKRLFGDLYDIASCLELSDYPTAQDFMGELGIIVRSF